MSTDPPIFWNPFGSVDDAQCPKCGGHDMHVSRTNTTRTIWLTCARLTCNWRGKLGRMRPNPGKN